MADVSRRGAALGGVALVTSAAGEADAFAFGLTAIEGGALPLARFRGKAMLVVNTASFCGYTPQYASLQRLHQRYEAAGLVVLGVPSTDFNQESHNAAVIKQFCDANYDVTFPMTTPVPVRGARAHPFFAWLAARGGGAPGWNFHKYLVARDGRSVRGYATAVEPEAPVLVRAVEAALAVNA